MNRAAELLPQDAPLLALVPTFARTADVIEEVAEWAGVHPAATLMAMRGVSSVWRGAVSSALRRMAAHEDEGWASASRVSDYVAAKPVVVRLCIVAGGGEWLREIPEGVLVSTTRHRVTASPFAVKEPGSVANSTVALPRLPRLTTLPRVSPRSASEAEMLFAALSTHCPELKSLSLELSAAEVLPAPSLVALPCGIESLTLSKSGRFGAAPAFDALLPRIAATLRDVLLDLPDCSQGVLERVVRECGPRLRRLRACKVDKRQLWADCGALEDVELLDSDHTTLLALAANCPNLQRVCVPGYLTAEGLVAIADGCKALTALQVGHTHLQAHEVVSFARRCRSLRVLKLGGVAGFDAAALTALAAASPQLELLSLPSVKEVSIPSEAMWQLAANAPPALRRLVVGNQFRITDNVLRAIASRCPMLRELRTRGAKVTDGGLIALARRCRELRVLELAYYVWEDDVRAAEDTLSDRGVDAVARGCRHLEILDLVGRWSVTDAGLRSLAVHARRLYRLRCTDPDDAGGGMTRAGIAEFAAATGAEVQVVPTWQ